MRATRAMRFLLSSLTLVLTVAFACDVPANAQALPTTSVVGSIVDQQGSLPVANATVELDQGTTKLATTRSSASGRYSFPAKNPGIYSIVITAQGFNSARIDELVIVGNEGSLVVNTTLVRSQVSSGSLREIGRVSTNSQNSLQASTVISRQLDTERLLRENYVRIGDALNTVPGVNLRGQSSALGDDLFVDIRGLKPSETQTLLDGHPIGPIGAFAFGGGFNYQDSPFYALGDVKVTFGSGALGLYGTDSIGGTVDWQTLNPTEKPQWLVRQGFGNQGKTLTDFQGSGTAGRLGYVLVHAVQGTYGDFPPARITQRGLVGNDLTTATAAANTYAVDADYLLRSDLLKLRYALSRNTNLTLTGLSGTSWDNKSGNGDNDFQTYEQQIYNGNQIVAAGPAQSLPNGNAITCPTGVGVLTDAHPTDGECVSVAQYAAGSSGPAGGGPGPWQAIRSQDYHARLNTALGKNQLSLDTFLGNYGLDYNRNQSSFDSAKNIFNGFFRSSTYKTAGTLLSDEITTEKNDFGFGYYVQHQRLDSNFYDTNPSNATYETIVNNPQVGLGNANVFVRDAWTPSSKISFFANAWFKRYSYTARNTSDPRLSVIFRPTPNDVIRLTGGRSDGQPGIQVPSLSASTAVNPGSCNNFSIGTVPNPTLIPESANDFEIAYGHRFKDDSNVQLDYYNTNVTNQLFGVSYPLSTFPNPLGPAQAQLYFARIRNICPSLAGQTDAQLLSRLKVSTQFNAANARFQGLELNGRYRANRHLFFDYAYDVQSAIELNVPTNVLRSNVNVINGSQIVGIPLHKASVSADYSDQHGLDIRLDGFYIGDNNGFNRPPYSYLNASVSKQFTKTIGLNLGLFNVFNSATDTYGRIGLGQYIPENQYGTDFGGPLSQGSERFGLSPRNFTLTLTTHTR